MRVLVQRSKNSKVTIDGVINGEINHGLVLLTGFTDSDNELIIDKMIDKIINLRIFEDDQDKMNLSLLDKEGSILNISQFTLYASCKNGRRPAFIKAMNPVDASRLYDYMNEKLKSTGINTQTGIFGADMKVEIYNDGPVTIMLDSDEIF